MRCTFLPYCLPFIGEEEIEEVADSLRSGWVTTGPKVKKFEADFAAYVGVKHAIAVNSCTAALELSLAALDIGPGDEVIVPTLTFCATANVVVHRGAAPVLVDVGEDFQIDPAAIERAITPKTRAIVPVHYGGQPCDLEAVLEIARRRGLAVVEDAAHAIGAQYDGQRIGVHGLMTAFSFYATKNMTTGEGGMLTTNDPALADRLRVLSLHGMSRDAWARYTEVGSWYYEVCEAGYKFNMTDLQAALGIHQLKRLDVFIARRRDIAAQYAAAFADLEGLILPVELPGRFHVYHLYPLRVLEAGSQWNRNSFIQSLREAKVGTSVHFIPLHRQPFYRDRCAYNPDSFPVADKIYSQIVSLPLYPKMSNEDVLDVIQAVRAVAASSMRKPNRSSRTTAA
jgi:dTDP-4-amino-4,6-dideoxygalactose transaminase